ncbi:MAG: hypothetical protein ABI581_03825 [Sediminibacterium sp.]
MISQYKIRRFFCRMSLLVVYGIFFAVQSTAYFDHKTGHTYRLDSDAFNTVKTVKHIQDGFSNGNSAEKKLTIRLNKKFQGQSAVLYGMFASRPNVHDFTKQPTRTYFDPLDATAFLTEHSLRGPPVTA